MARKPKRSIGSVELSGEFNSNNDPAANVLVGNDASAGQSHDRFQTLVAETRATMGHMTFGADEKVDNFQIKLVPKTGTPAAGAVVRFVVDAMPVDDTTDDSQAWNWLQAATASEDTDVMYKEVKYVADANLSSGKDAWSEVFSMGSYIRRLDFHFPAGTAGTTDFDIYMRKV